MTRRKKVKQEEGQGKICRLTVKILCLYQHREEEKIPRSNKYSITSPRTPSVYPEMLIWGRNQETPK